jgi:hypothetical protein
MLVITNSTIGNAEREMKGFQFEKADFFVEEEADGLVLKAETPTGYYIVKGVSGMDAACTEMRRLAEAAKAGAAYDDKNVYKQLAHGD